MFFLYFLVLFLNLYTGFLIFNCYPRTLTINFQKLSLLCISTAASLLFLFKFSFIKVIVVLYTPLFIGFLPKLILICTYSRRRSQNYKTTLTLLECIDIHLQMGQSFTNSLGLALKNLPSNSNLNINLKKNVVLQQPKSRNCTIFSELTQNLNTLSQQNLGKRDLLTFIKYKFRLNSELEEKIELSSTQYKTQSYALIFFWLISLAALVTQGQLFTYKNTVLLSFCLMLLGILLAKKLIVKTQFRI